MTTSPDRLRQHPEDRFHPEQLPFDLKVAAAKLLHEPLEGKPTHRQKALYRHGPLTIALFIFEAGAGIPQHVAQGVVTIHVLEGQLTITAEDQVHHLSPGHLLALAPGVQHDVHAQIRTQMLLTVCLGADKPAP